MGWWKNCVPVSITRDWGGHRCDLGFTWIRALLCGYPPAYSCSQTPRHGLGEPYYDETGYSGMGPGKNNPGAQDEPGVGPIPRGGCR
jgi:hypothetical protein